MKPKIAFPVHDAILANPQMMYGFMGGMFKENGIELVPAELGKAYEF